MNTEIETVVVLGFLPTVEPENCGVTVFGIEVLWLVDEGLDVRAIDGWKTQLFDVRQKNRIQQIGIYVGQTSSLRSVIHRRIQNEQVTGQHRFTDDRNDCSVWSYSARPDRDLTLYQPFQCAIIGRNRNEVYPAIVFQRGIDVTTVRRKYRAVGLTIEFFCRKQHRLVFSGLNNRDF